MPGRTLARRFEAELGMSLRSWRRRLRVLLGGGLGVTQTAMGLGYGSTSAFIFAFATISHTSIFWLMKLALSRLI